MGFTCFPSPFWFHLRTNSGQSSGDYCLMRKMAAHILLLDLEKIHFICILLWCLKSFANVLNSCMYFSCFTALFLFQWNACIAKISMLNLSFEKKNKSSCLNNNDLLLLDGKYKNEFRQNIFIAVYIQASNTTLQDQSFFP